MNYFRCKVCNKLCDLDSNFCDSYHQRYWVEYHRAFKKWLQRGTPLLDYVPTQEWETSFLPLDKGGLHPHMERDPKPKEKEDECVYQNGRYCECTTCRNNDLRKG